MSINRIVILLSPIFVGLAGWVVELIARYAPGHPKLDRGELTAIFILGASAMAAKILLWIHGWQKHETRLPLPASPASPTQPPTV